MILTEIQTAGLPHVIRTVIIIIVVWYALRIIIRYVAPWLMKKGINRMQRKAEEQMRSQFGHQNRPQEEGKITVEKTKGSSGNSGGDDGEYIDFEEVD